ncbi:MAG: hypothetical protein WCP58_09790 [bacterium]
MESELFTAAIQVGGASFSSASRGERPFPLDQGETGLHLVQCGLVGLDLAGDLLSSRMQHLPQSGRRQPVIQEALDLVEGEAQI